MPSPADLARARPRPAPVQPPKSPPPRGRRLAEIESERAQRALRALVADPATDFVALDADEFFAALKCACQDGTVSQALIADVERRIASGTAAPRELHQVLFAAGEHQAWASARAMAMAAAARAPHDAVTIVGMEAQRLGVPAMRVTESANENGFTARASLDRGGALIEGETVADNSKKRARQGAAMSLLAALTGLIAETVGTHPVPRARPQPPAPPSSAPPSSAPPSSASGMTAADLEAWLDYEVSQPSPDPEFAAEITARKLSPRAVYLLLFEADPTGWAHARAQAWEALAPSIAAGVLSMYTQSRSWPPAFYIEPDDRVAVAFVNTPDGPVVGEPTPGTTPKAARAAAALALIKDLAPPAANPATPEPAPGPNPVAALNEHAQTGVITGLSYEFTASGPPHQPVFTCTARCGNAADGYTAVAAGNSKNAAKIAAAVALLGQISDAERSVVTRPAPLRHEQGQAPGRILARLLRAGCALDFSAGQEFLLTMPSGADLQGPLAGWGVPLPVGLPVLAALTADKTLHASTRTWASAARAALEAVAARRVYPALDAEGRDVWRLPPDIDAPAEFLDAVAESLLRSRGARLVVGDVPYAGHPRVLDDAAAEWADRAAEAAEGTEAKPLLVRVNVPVGDGAPLLAEVRCPRIGHAEYRLLRRAARDWPPLDRIRREGTLSGTDAAQLLGPMGERLAALRITVEWPADLMYAGGLGVRAVARPRSAEPGAFSLTGAADLTWQLTLDGEPLSEQETAAIAAAVAGVTRIRGRWVVIDPETARKARDRSAGRLTGAQALSAVLTGQVTVGGQEVACAAAGRLAEIVAELRDVGSGAEPFSVSGGLRAELRGYQQRAVAWLTRMTALGFGVLLADDMGLGKTLTVIAYHVHRRGDGPSLVVCPASLLANWEREFTRFAPDVPVRRYHGSGRSLDDMASGQVVVTTYGTLLRQTARLATISWDTVVADEAQQVKNHRAQAAAAIRSLTSEARIAVTGTPVENSLSELWAILDWTNPGLFGTLAAFRERYGRAAEREADGDAARRLGRLIAPFVMRRRKADPDVAPELPDKVVSDRFVQLSREQTALYQAVTSEALTSVTASSGIERRGQVLRLLQSLRQICNSPAHFLRESPEGWDPGAQAARSGKLQALEELLESVVLAEDAALVFTGYVSMGHLIQAHLTARGYTTGFLHGGLPIARRQEIVDRFQAGSGDALILSVRAAGTGLNLTRAGHVIHFDRPWNPAVEDQATDRAHRIGQHRLVEVHHLIAEGTVEDRIAELLARKRGLTEAVLAGGETALTELSDGELRALVSLSADTDADADTEGAA
jgi:superfamily II DNA or RNA helicase